MQGERPRRLSERTVDFGLAAMEFCETLPRTAAGRHIGFRRPAAEVLQQPAASSQQPATSEGRLPIRFPLAAEHWLLAAETLRSEATPKALTCPMTSLERFE